MCLHETVSLLDKYLTTKLNLNDTNLAYASITVSQFILDLPEYDRVLVEKFA